MTQRIAVIPGDGIGIEVIDAARIVLDALAARHGLDLAFQEFDWSCARYAQSGTMMPADGIDTLREFDAVLLGAVGWPGVPDHVSLWGLLVPIRRAFHQFVNHRPARTFAGVPSPLTGVGPGDIDILVVRENTEGEYSQVGGRFNHGLPEETAVQEAVFTRRGISRVADYAFEAARSRSGRLVSATKSNGIVHTMPFWDEVVASRAAEFPQVEWRSEHIDALAAKVVLAPRSLDVILASNLFGDVLSDLTAAATGSIGLAASANLNPSGEYPSMFEPVHGSAPDIAGRGIANPVGALWSVVLMLEQLGHPEAASDLMRAIERSLADASTRTGDVGGNADTAEVTEFILSTIGAGESG